MQAMAACGPPEDNMKNLKKTGGRMLFFLPLGLIVLLFECVPLFEWSPRLSEETADLPLIILGKLLKSRFIRRRY